MGTEQLSTAKPTVESCVCKECKEGFEPYRRGATVVKSICGKCLTAKTLPKKKNTAIATPKLEPPAPGRSNVGVEPITLTFAESDRGLFQRIKDIARRERRAVDSQILYWIETHVPELRGEQGPGCSK